MYLGNILYKFFSSFFVIRTCAGLETYIFLTTLYTAVPRNWNKHNTVLQLILPAYNSPGSSTPVTLVMQWRDTTPCTLISSKITLRASLPCM